ncbi:MAG: DUF2127 domain-containing protein [Deltaproteobacteria bacterium]|nr:DUF2127 domain-containing protein [Deltaproteobacteria bacterium]
MRKRKGENFLRFIIAYKALMGLMEASAAASFYYFLDAKGTIDSFTTLAINFNIDPDNRLISSLIDRAGALGNDTMLGITITVFAIGVVNCVEAVGLHYRQRWAEWLTVAATGALIPFELYEVMESVSALKVTILVINIAVVYYLGKHKELFGKKARQRAKGI